MRWQNLIFCIDIYSLKKSIKIFEKSLKNKKSIICSTCENNFIEVEFTKLFEYSALKNDTLNMVISISWVKFWVLTDTGEFAPKWARVFSTRRWVILFARMRRKKKEENIRVHFGANQPVDKFRVLACIG